RRMRHLRPHPPTREATMEKQTQTEIEAAAFRDLVAHLQKRTDVQNIDLMNLAGFCRNCLAKWYKAEAERRGENIDYDQAREYGYGMPYTNWKSKYQKESSDAQQTQFAALTQEQLADTDGGN